MSVRNITSPEVAHNPLGRYILEDPDVVQSDGLGDRAFAGDVDEGPWVRGYDVTSGPTAFRTLPNTSDSFPEISRRETGARLKMTEWSCGEWSELGRQAWRAAVV